VTDELSSRIDRLLIEHRPDRYETADRSWMDPVVAAIAPDIPEAEMRILHAEKLVRDREAKATTTANRLIRDMWKTKQPPLEWDWMDAMSYPVSISKEWRIALRALTPGDLVDFANYERKAAATEFVTRNETCDAAEFFAEEMQARGTRHFGDFEF
jgi:RimJ/RimL family protein N-acetyltransferase